MDTHVKPSYPRPRPAAAIVGILVILAAAAYAVTGPAPAAKAAPAASQLTQGYLDTRSGQYLRVQLDPASPTSGDFVVAIPNVGLVWPAGHADVTTEAATSTQLRYDGDGFTDPGATLDPEFGVGYRQQGAGRPVHVRLIGQVDPAHSTASVRVWVNDSLTNIVTHPVLPKSSAADAAAAYLAALGARDWNTLYAMEDGDLRANLTEAQFAQGMASAPEGQDITQATAGAPTVSTNAAGLTYANVPIHLTHAAKAPTAGTLVLILQGAGWKVFTVK